MLHNHGSEYIQILLLAWWGWGGGGGGGGGGKNVPAYVSHFYRFKKVQ